MSQQLAEAERKGFAEKSKKGTSRKLAEEPAKLAVALWEKRNAQKAVVFVVLFGRSQKKNDEREKV